MSEPVLDAWGIRTAGTDYLVIPATPCNVAILGEEIDQIRTPDPIDAFPAASLDEVLGVRQLEGGARQVLVLRRYQFGGGLLLTCSPRVERFGCADILSLPRILAQTSAFRALLTASGKVRALELDLSRLQRMYNNQACEGGPTALPCPASESCPETFLT